MGWLSKLRRNNNNGDDDNDGASFASGELEYEHLTSGASTTTASLTATTTTTTTTTKPRNMKLTVAFICLIITGTANAIFIKLQAISLYNYPNFINLYGCAIFIPLLFLLYIIPAYSFGWFQNSITDEQWNMSKRPFLIMGGLDCITGMMQVFSAVYLPGPLLVLLPQAAIPMSMIFSKHFLKSKYTRMQYVGAIVVLLGIVVVLEPELTHRNVANEYLCEAVNIKQDCTVCNVELTKEACLSHRLDVHPTFLFTDNNNDDDEGQSVCEWIPASEASAAGLIIIWSGIVILSCIPMTLSTLYKEIVLSRDNMDPLFLNGWIVVFQTVFSAVLAAPAGLASSPPVLPSDLPQNIRDGFTCYYHGRGSITDGCHPDTDCANAAFVFNTGLMINLLFMLTMMMVVKWGSTSLLFLALTIMVPLGNVVFAVMPNAPPVHASDLLGLTVILGGLVLYRYFSVDEGANDDQAMLREPLLEVVNDESSSPPLLEEPPPRTAVV